MMLSLLLTLVVVGVVLWAIEQFPLDPTIRTLIRVVIVVTVVVWLAQFLMGVMPATFPQWPHR